MSSERDFQLHPIVQDSVIHNSKVRPPTSPADETRGADVLLRCSLPIILQALSNLHSLAASLFGVSAGILGLESYSGFLFYLALSTVTTLLFYALQVAPESLAEKRPLFSTARYFHGAADFWTGGILSGLSGFVLTWTLFYGLVRA